MIDKKIGKKNISLNLIDAFIFDFDGVLTDNLVHITEDGSESVSCSRSDGLAFETLRKINIPTYILSTETNLVVSQRAKKLKIQAIQGVKNKAAEIKSLAIKKNYDLESIFYIGNDLNDYFAMTACGFSACPADSHPLIKDVADIILKANGGSGVARELVEDVLSIDILKILYNN